jgi:hypothetical protein
VISRDVSKYGKVYEGLACRPTARVSGFSAMDKTLGTDRDGRDACLGDFVGELQGGDR